MINTRIGFGFDVHQLKENKDFWLGGILLDHYKGAIGHSDADVLIHSICDALLGASNLGDIGSNFPDSSNEFKGIDSKIILSRTVELIRNKGFEIVNIDSTICLQNPKIQPYIQKMKIALSNILNITVDRISIKATTTEHLGFVGREEGVSAYAIALIYKK